ncbi:Ndufc2p [Mactra antiquata]
MESSKVTADENYNYTSKVPDFITGNGIVIGAGTFYYRNYTYLLYGSRSNASKLAFVMKQLPFYLLGGYIVGKAVSTAKDNYLKKRLIYMEDYIERHPEEFRELPKKKYGDLLEKWQPVR